MMVKIEKVRPGNNIRRSLGRLDGLVASIEAVGILEPLVVYPEEDGFVLIAGHRRLEAAKRAGLEQVPVEIKEDWTPEQIDAAMLIENFHRDDLTPMEEAEALFRLDELGHDVKTIGTETGMSQRLIRERLKLKSLPTQAQDLVHSGQLTLGAAGELAKEDEAVVIALVEMLEDRDQNISRVDYLLDQARAKIHTANVMEKLRPALDELRSRGIAVANIVDGDERPELSRSLAIHDGYNGLDLPIKKHRQEECHQVVIDQRYWGQEPSMTEWCTNPKRHDANGASDLKRKDADKRAEEKAQERAERAVKKEQREQSIESYREALKASPKAGELSEILTYLAIDKAHADTKKLACQILGLEVDDSRGWKDWGGTFDAFTAQSDADRKRGALTLAIAYYDPLGPEPNRWAPEGVKHMQEWFETT